MKRKKISCISPYPGGRKIMNYTRIIVCLFILCIGMPLNAEKFALGMKLCSFSMHPTGTPNAHLMPLKLDTRGILVFNPGVSLSAEYFAWKDILSIKYVQGLYGDCALQFLGFSHIGFRVHILQLRGFSLNLGIGPTFIYRQSWYKLHNYKDTPKFFHGSHSENWEYRFIWYGGEIETNIDFGNFSLSCSVIPGGLDLINTSIGIRHIINTKHTK